MSCAKHEFTWVYVVLDYKTLLNFVFSKFSDRRTVSLFLITIRILIRVRTRTCITCTINTFCVPIISVILTSARKKRDTVYLVHLYISLTSKMLPGEAGKHFFSQRAGKHLYYLVISSTHMSLALVLVLV